MTWVLVLLAAWIAVAVCAAILIGRSIHLADQRTLEAPTNELDPRAAGLGGTPLGRSSSRRATMVS